jgi:hypothetical protein
MAVGATVKFGVERTAQQLIGQAQLARAQALANRQLGQRLIQSVVGKAGD